MTDKIRSTTCTAPVNIAVIKYWGKRDENLILPTNSSLSGTLDQSQLRAKTSVAACRDFTADRMWLNGEEQSMTSSRLQNVFKEIRRRARCQGDGDANTDWLDWKVHICSENNFPTAAGLASSAAGLACLVSSLCNLYHIKGDISDIARLGSGSACRSVYGGWVEWLMGEKEDGTDSVANQIAPETHWPEMRVLILVVSGEKKPIGSTAGMQTSVKTSSLLNFRIPNIVPKRMQSMRHAILNKDYPAFAELTMKDSNQLHACCLDTYPPICYMTDTSRDIIRMVHAINDYLGQTKVCYTFDAGPNACLYILQEMVPMVLGIVKHFFPSENDNFITGLPSNVEKPSLDLLNSIAMNTKPDAIQYVIHTKIGPGPQVLTDPNESLLTSEGMPKSIK